MELLLLGKRLRNARTFFLNFGSDCVDFKTRSAGIVLSVEEQHICLQHMTVTIAQQNTIF